MALRDRAMPPMAGSTSGESAGVVRSLEQAAARLMVSRAGSRQAARGIHEKRGACVKLHLGCGRGDIEVPRWSRLALAARQAWWGSTTAP